MSHQRKEQLINNQILHTESSTHTIVVKESLCEDDDDEDEDMDEEYCPEDDEEAAIGEAQFASGRNTL